MSRQRGIGIDIASITRFKRFAKNKKDRFLLSVFTEREREYCFSFKDPAPHLAGIFAAKESVIKALTEKKVRGMAEVEIRHARSGKPEVWLRARRLKGVLVSISHDATIAIAVAVSA
jgi:holo-[acyl-carrier protein] synthase